MRTLFTFKFEGIFLWISNKNQGYKQEKHQKKLRKPPFLIILLKFKKNFLKILLIFEEKRESAKGYILRLTYNIFC